MQLTITSNNDVEKRHNISVSKDALDHAIRNIVSAYVSGASTIILKGEGMYTVAEEARKVLSGVEITDETESLIIMKIRTDFVDLQYDTILRRIYNITRSMFSLTIKSFEGAEKHLEEINRKESEVDRLYLLALRQVSSSSSRPAQDEAVFKSIAAKAIEKISDHIETIYTSGDRFMPNKEIARLLAKALDVYGAAYGFFADGSPEISQ
ncbi:MAG: phosphate uptake regulator PhoU, partial [Candidatus Aenigmarchaeota archaeon]|nr:phosphate uptake regulator PhoU [Candidatus Aenigmarchaeota archaeon]